jgi:hypothetical protein
MNRYERGVLLPHEKSLLDIQRDAEKLADVRRWIAGISDGSACIQECTRQFASDTIAFLVGYIDRMNSSPGSLKRLVEENINLRTECKRLWKLEAAYRRMRRQPELPARLNAPA